MTSLIRRRLLTVLWIERSSGDATALAARVACTRAGAYRELRLMVRSGLAVVRREGGASGKDVYLGNFDHPGAAALLALLETSKAFKP